MHDTFEMIVIGNVRCFWFNGALIRQMPRLPLPTVRELREIDQVVEKLKESHAAD